MKSDPTSARTTGRAWLKIALLVLLPLGLTWVVRERASWRPRTMPWEWGCVLNIAFSPDGKYLAVAAHDKGSGYGGVDLWDAQGQALVRRSRMPGQDMDSVIFSPDSSKLATFSLDTYGSQVQVPAIKIWSVATGRLLRTFYPEVDSVMDINWVGDVLLLQELSEDDHVIKVTGMMCWDAGTGERLSARASASRSGFPASVFSSDGSLKSDSTDSGVEVRSAWNSTLKQMLKDLHPDYLRITLLRNYDGFAISPDNTLLAVMHDKTIQVWSVRSGALLRALATSDFRFEALAFSSDGSTLATSSGGGGTDAIMLWRVK